jgi:ankyrin repeat protein/L-ascorbate metabolism protein UlaG (beta-lactamase superfamily)
MIKINRVIFITIVLLLGFFMTNGWAGGDAGVTGIHKAALEGDLEAVKSFLKKDASLRDADGRNQKKPLHWAAQGGHQAVAAFLLKLGAPIDCKNIAGETPLQYAAAFGHKELVKFLLEKGASLQAKTNYNGTALSSAAEGGHAGIVKFLVAKGADVRAGEQNGFTLLQRGAWKGSKEVIALLIDLGIPADAKTDFGRTPLQQAAMGGNSEAVKVLIAKGADVNHRGDEDWPPLYLAAKRGHAGVVSILLDAGATVDIKHKKSGQTPLHLAALRGYGQVAALLLDKGADPDARDANGKTPIEYAARYGHGKVAKALIKKGAAFEKTEKFKKRFGFSPLLQKPFKPGGALVWYLGHSGWAVKTGNHLLIFDYFKGDALPDTPLITNGTINPEEIEDLKVTVLVSHSHGDHYMPAIFDWKKQVSDITYVMGFKPDKQSGYIYLEPGTAKTVNGMEITALESNDSGAAFYVTVEGVEIFHPGDHANRKKDFSGPFKKEIDYLAKKGLKPDICFAPVSGCGFGDLESVKKGIYYTVKKLSPGALFPMHAGGNEDRYAGFAGEVKKAGLDIPVYCAGNSGDWFYVNQGKVKKASSLLAMHRDKAACEGKKAGEKKECKTKSKKSCNH